MLMRSLARWRFVPLALSTALVACGSVVTTPDSDLADARDAVSVADILQGDAGDAVSVTDIFETDAAAMDALPNEASRPPDASMSDARSEGTIEPFDSGTIPTPPTGVTTCGEVLCSAGEQCCFATGLCFDPATPSACATPPRSTDPGACASNEQCATGEFCDVSAGASSRCAGTGTCTPVRGPESCGGFGAGVCGCDGRTYPDPCAASRAGVRLAAMVPCGTLAYPNAGFTQACVPGGIDCDHLYDSHCDATLGHCVANHPIFACGFSAQCPAGQTCCGITGLCVDSSVPELCQVPPPGSWFPCRIDSDCAPFDPSFTGPSTLYCGGPGCGPGGGCFRPSGSCSGVLAPVCGCDGMSYTNDCWAGQARVRVAHTGSCP